MRYRTCGILRCFSLWQRFLREFDADVAFGWRFKERPRNIRNEDALLLANSGDESVCVCMCERVSVLCVCVFVSMLVPASMRVCIYIYTFIDNIYTFI